MRFLEKHATFALTLLSFFFLVLLVNPLRETSVGDDWTYAHTVKNLLDTGHYKLHEASMANIFFQAYWGAAFCKVLGYSFVSLKISTLTLLFLSLFAFYGLAREHGLDRSAAGLIPLAYLGGPLIPRFAFSFYSEIPFLSCIVIALFLYTRGLRLRNFGWMLAGSLAASCAILTRQFGVAFVPGLFLLWIVQPVRFRQTLLFAAGAALPVAVAGWQVYSGLAHPSMGAQSASHLTLAYLTSGPLPLIKSFWSRSVISLQYMALLFLPLTCLGVLLTLRNAGGMRPACIVWYKRANFCLAALGVLTLLFAMAIPFLHSAHPLLQGRARLRFGALGTLFLTTGLLLPPALGAIRRGGHFPARNMLGSSWVWSSALAFVAGGMFLHCKGGSWFWPYLSWSLEDLHRWGVILPAFLSVITAGCTVFLSHLFLTRYMQEWKTLPLEQRFLDCVMLFFLGAILLFSIIGDRYVITLLPLGGIVLGRYLAPWLVRLRVPVAIALCGMLLLSGIWVRGQQTWEEASWKGAEWLRQQGIPETKIYNTLPTWVLYYRVQECLDILAANPPKKLTEDSDVWKRWSDSVQAKAEYVVDYQEPAPGTSVKLLKEIPYRDLFFAQRKIYVSQRLARPEVKP
ncbi:TPA: hypothetical protein DDW35_07550 [Candidatus Sumerlaeota bacterium]|nr:hypothetical protein [Candidatus Sumerlaeota bacterium]